MRAVVDAQDVLDEHALERAAAFAAAPAGTLAVPPLWYAFDSVSVQIELSAEAVLVAADGGPQTQLVCRLLNPVTAGLYGYSAATGTRVSVTLAPRQAAAPPPTTDATT